MKQGYIYSPPSGPWWSMATSLNRYLPYLLIAIVLAYAVKIIVF